MNFNKMTFEEKFGQMLMLGLDIYEINDEVIKLIEQYKIGGVVLYKKNYTSLETMIDVINKLKKINHGNSIPLFIAIDQENGRVNRFPKDINRIYSAYKQAKSENMKLVNSVNELTSYLLKSVGVNMNFAPVLDITRDHKKKVIGNRSYGKNKEDVIKYGMPFMKCLQENNIISVIKHFPGHGITNKDSHISFHKINDIDELNKNDLIPFEYAIKNNADAIMIGHIKIKGYGLMPATLNKKIINEMLIDKYSYKGLIVTDDIRMGLFNHIYGIKKSVIKAVNSGNDIIMVKYKRGDILRIYKDLYKMVRNYEIDIERINNSAKKIVNMKKKYKINDSEINCKLEIDLINKRIKKINELIDREIGV